MQAFSLFHYISIPAKTLSFSLSQSVSHEEEEEKDLNKKAGRGAKKKSLLPAPIFFFIPPHLSLSLFHCRLI